MVKPAAMNITRNPQTKKRNVLKIKPTSAETVVSAAAGTVNKNSKLTIATVFFLNKLFIKTPLIILLKKSL
jgi:hypothetical protein